MLTIVLSTPHGSEHQPTACRAMCTSASTTSVCHLARVGQTRSSPSNCSSGLGPNSAESNTMSVNSKPDLIDPGSRLVEPGCKAAETNPNLSEPAPHVAGPTSNFGRPQTRFGRTRNEACRPKFSIWSEFDRIRLRGLTSGMKKWSVRE